MAEPTTAAQLLLDALGRVRGLVASVVGDLGVEELLWQPDPAANSIAWLVWHLTRVEDDHVAGIAGTEQVWTADGWDERFDLPYAAHDFGFGHSAEDVRAFRLEDPVLLTGYQDAVHGRAVEVVEALTDEDLARVVDDRWDPPVTAAVRLVSVIGDTTQHVGQAAYVKGLHERA